MTAVAEPQTRQERVAAALADPDHLFTSAQVMDLLSLMLENDDSDLAYRAGFSEGYWSRVAEENGAYLRANEAGTTARWSAPPRGPLATTAATARRENAIAASFPWRGDHPGGTVPVWGDGT